MPSPKQLFTPLAILAKEGGEFPGDITSRCTFTVLWQVLSPFSMHLPGMFYVMFSCRRKAQMVGLKSPARRTSATVLSSTTSSSSLRIIVIRRRGRGSVVTLCLQISSQKFSNGAIKIAQTILMGWQSTSTCSSLRTPRAGGCLFTCVQHRKGHG